MKNHTYTITTIWTGNTGSGTESYRTYERSHTITQEGKQKIEGSSDPSFRGDPLKYSPEDLLLASLSACHMLSYLHLCAVAGIVVTAYEDKAVGIMVENDNGGGHFTEAILKPVISIKDKSMADKALSLHHEANKLCFIANSCNFPVKHEPVFV